MSKPPVGSSPEESPETRPALRVKPRFRGSSHYAGFFAALGAGAVLVAAAPDTRSMLAALIYTLSLANLLGTSAFYHRPTWSPERRALIRKFDHIAIYVLIAGTITPICMLAVDKPLSTTLLWIIWIVGVLGGVIKEFLWPKAPKLITAILFIAFGWVGAIAIPSLYRLNGILPVILVALGGLAYTLGAMAYAFRRPDPAPETFGYHEIFHICVIIAGILHFMVVAQLVLP